METLLAEVQAGRQTGQETANREVRRLREGFFGPTDKRLVLQRCVRVA